MGHKAGVKAHNHTACLKALISTEEGGYNSDDLIAANSALQQPLIVSTKAKRAVVLNAHKTVKNVLSVLATIQKNVAFFRFSVKGNEGNGIRKEIISVSSGSVIIPMQPGAESLNASAAATVLLWEQYRITKKQ